MNTFIYFFIGAKLSLVSKTYFVIYIISSIVFCKLLYVVQIKAFFFFFNFYNDENHILSNQNQEMKEMLKANHQHCIIILASVP